MRYELRLTAFDMLDQIHVSAVLYSSPPDDPDLSGRVWATTVTCRGRGTETAKAWTREVLEATLEAL